MHRRIRSSLSWAITAVSLAVGINCPAADPLPLGLKPLKPSKTNPTSPEKIQLGRQLFFDTRLSSDNTVSCASCHDPAKGWSNGEATAQGVDGQRGGRSAPTLLNAAYHRFQFWDGRAQTLEDQALGPIANPIEMNLPIETAVKKIGAIQGYADQFQDIFGHAPNAEDMGKAIAAFERTIVSGNSPYDRYKAGDKTALSPKAEAGRKLFFGKANCSACHAGTHLSDNAFHNVGVNFGSDIGREAISKMSGDRGSFKTPPLRDIAKTGPYMHDGSLATLQAVIDHYDKGGDANEFQDEEIYPLKLSAEKKSALLEFLTTGLASDDYPAIQPPTLPK